MEKTRFLNIYRCVALLAMMFSNMNFVSADISKVLCAFGVAVIFMSVGAECSIRRDKLSILSAFKMTIIPYITFSVILICYDLYRIYASSNSFLGALLKQRIMDSLTLYGSGYLWILPTLLFAYLIFEFVSKVGNNVISFLILLIFASAYIAAGGLQGFINPNNNTTQAIIFRILMVIWRSVLMSGFVYLGSFGMKLIEVIRKKYILVISGFVLTIIGIVFAFFNDRVIYETLLLGNPVLFYASAFCIGTGLLFITEWINVFPIMEIFGKGSIVFISTFDEFGIVQLSTTIDVYMVALANNYFVGHSCAVLLIVLLELLLICIFSMVLPFVIGVKRNNPFSGYKKQEKDI